MSTKFLKIHPSDNVFVALTDLKAGEVVDLNGELLPLTDDIPAKHKFTERAIQPEDKIFLGYHRPDGQVGTANYWLIVPLVFCENRNVEAIRDAFMDELGFAKPDAYKDYVHQLVELYQNNKPITSASFQPAAANGHSRIFKNIDGIKFLTHQGGCGGTRQDSQTLCKLIGGYIHNPNVAGATVLSLGCQNAEIKTLQEALNKLDPAGVKPVFILDQQQSGSEQELLTQAIQKTFASLIEADKIERKPAPLSKLVV